MDFFFPHMRWNTGEKLYKVTKRGEIWKFFHLEFFPGGNFANKSKWIYSKIPPEIYLEKTHLEKKIQLEYIQTIGSPIQLLTMILLLNFTDFPSA